MSPPISALYFAVCDDCGNPDGTEQPRHSRREAARSDRRVGWTVRTDVTLCPRCAPAPPAEAAAREGGTS